MKLTVNGEEKEIPDGQMLRELIVDMKLDHGPVAAELNRQVVPRKNHESTVLSDGDVLELVTLVGGG